MQEGMLLKRTSHEMKCIIIIMHDGSTQKPPLPPPTLTKTKEASQIDAECGKEEG